MPPPPRAAGRGQGARVEPDAVLGLPECVVDALDLAAEITRPLQPAGDLFRFGFDVEAVANSVEQVSQPSG
jgi:hypothetical protein